MDDKPVFLDSAKDTLEYIISYKIRNDGCSPTLREIVAAVDSISSTSHASDRLDTLVLLGLIRYIFSEVNGIRGSKKRHSIAVTGGSWIAPEDKGYL